MYIVHSGRLLRALAVVVTALHSTAVYPALAGPQAGTTPPAASQAPAAQAAPHIYRVSAFRAASGQMRNVEKLLASTPAPGADAGDFAVVFRHRQGHEWDFMTVEHMGATATVGLPSGPPATGDSPMSQSVAWHGDTYVAGPPLEEFRRALNLQGATGQSAGGTPGVYVVSDYMAAAGHRGQLRQVLDKIAMDTPGRSITLTHVQGAPWTFLVITRYDSWRQFAEEEEKAGAQDAKAPAGDRGMEIREHLATHHDTLVTVQAVVTGSPAR
jgi:hypothetical protein